jgi:hypothetical protein
MRNLLLFALGLLAGMASLPLARSASSLSLGPSLQAAPYVLPTFEFPGAGERNNNQTIGDFCCTGETATVRISDGTPCGYIYFCDFRGGINKNARSAAASFAVLVSAASQLAWPVSRAKSSLEFSAKDLKPGLTLQTRAGALQFTATILGVQFPDKSHSRFWMDTLKVRVDVQKAPATH